MKSKPTPLQRAILSAFDWEFQQDKNAKLNTIYLYATLCEDHIKMF